MVSRLAFFQPKKMVRVAGKRSTRIACWGGKMSRNVKSTEAPGLSMPLPVESFLENAPDSPPNIIATPGCVSTPGTRGKSDHMVHSDVA